MGGQVGGRVMMRCRVASAVLACVSSWKAGRTATGEGVTVVAAPVAAAVTAVSATVVATTARPSRQRGARINFRNLIPVPEPRLWQSTPEAPLRDVQSEPARAALACCNLQSSMVEGQNERGRAAYACFVGYKSWRHFAWPTQRQL